jgi:hypothetical protein
MTVSRPIVLGYHGCDRALAQKVVAGKAELRPSKNDYDWLGHGIYFGEDSPRRAMQWAQKERRAPEPRVRIRTPVVLGAVIDLGNCLNLVDAEALELVKAAYQTYQAICQASGKEEARNKGRDFGARFLDCAVLETLHQIREETKALPFDTVRGFFVEGKELYPGAGMRGQDHVQICVRSPKQILGYFLPRHS